MFAIKNKEPKRIQAYTYYAEKEGNDRETKCQSGNSVSNELFPWTWINDNH